ncbi:Protein patched 2 [Geranomyces variabilis]|uniref:Protein patched 2 n=1 Tax=Geranomyces variabilis TaxID=109894 RepID=A0AAD5TMZ4_9FUNG|nr:Protein patched 2 [Geranomyces variabilis]
MLSISLRVQAALLYVATGLARVLCVHPKRCIAATLSCAVFLSLGVFRVRLLIDPVALLNDYTSPVEPQFPAEFKDQGGISFVLQPAASGQNVLNKHFLGSMMKLSSGIMAMPSEYNGQSFTLGDFCTKGVDSKGRIACLTDDPTANFWDSLEALNNDPRIERTLSLFHSGICGLSGTASSSTFGGLTYRDGPDKSPQIVEYAASLRYSVPMLGTEAGTEKAGAADAWEATAMEFLQNSDSEGKALPDGEAYRVYYLTTTSITEELRGSVIETVWLFIAGILIMLLYLSAALGRFNRVDSSVGFTLFALANSVLGMAAGIGLTSALGVALNPLTLGVLPFLVFGVALDNVFLLSRQFNAAEGDLSYRMRYTYKTIGYALVTTNMEMVLGLFLACIIPMNLIRAMCMMCAATLVVNTAMLLTSVSAAMILDERRRKENRLDLFCWLSAPTRHLPSGPRWLDVQLGKIYASLIGGPRIKWGVVYAFIALLAITPAGIVHIVEDLQPSLLCKSNGLVAGYFDAVARDYKGSSSFTAFVSDPDQLSVSARANALQLQAALGESAFTSGEPTHWLSPFLTWLRLASSHTHELVDNEPPQDKIEPWVREFLNDTTYGGACLQSMVLWQDDKVIGSKMLGGYSYHDTVPKYAPAVKDVKRIVGAATIQASSSASIDPIALLFDAMRPKTPLAFFLFILGMVPANLVLFGNWVSTLCSVPIFVGTVLVLLASLPVLRAEMNPFATVIILISMAFAADCMGYVQKAYLEAVGNQDSESSSVTSWSSDATEQDPTRTQAPRSREQWYTKTAVSLTYSLIGTLISALPLTLSPIAVVSKLFFRVFLTAAVVAWFGSLVVYPNLLEIFGFRVKKGKARSADMSGSRKVKYILLTRESAEL